MTRGRGLLLISVKVSSTNLCIMDQEETPWSVIHRSVELDFRQAVSLWHLYYSNITLKPPLSNVESSTNDHLFAARNTLSQFQDICDDWIIRGVYIKQHVNFKSVYKRLDQTPWHLALLLNMCRLWDKSALVMGPSWHTRLSPLTFMFPFLQ